MIHVLQSLRTGETQLADVPVPKASAASLVVETRASLISPGTERMLVDFGRAGWLDKARSQPDKVRQVIAKARLDGLSSTIEAVRAKLDAPLSPGYCQAGVVRETGRKVTAFAAGDRVVTNGPHAEYVRVAETLAARIPGNVSYEAAAFTPLAAIGLQGLRLARPTLGETVVVYGLGPIGLLTVQLCNAAGCKVIAIDRSVERCEIAKSFGARILRAEDGRDLAPEVFQLTDGVGTDMVLLTLSTDSDEPVAQAAQMCRKRARLVLIGVTGLHLVRDDFYKKELSFQVSCSYGPGRYDPNHEEAGIDYPLPYVRWTEGRNFAAVLALMSEGRLDPSSLITHRFPIAEADAAYRLIASEEPSLGVLLTYDEKPSALGHRAIDISTRKTSAGRGRVAFIGAGNFASRVLIPAFKEAGASLEVVASGGGVSATIAGKQHGFMRVTSDANAAINDEAVDTVVVATRHDSHAEWVTRSLGAGKHVFVEKPLALKIEELASIGNAARAASGILCVGFNRRYAPHVKLAKRAADERAGVAAISITVNAGAIPGDHWTQNPETGGGRIVGEASHFIDLARFLVGSPITALQVMPARTAAGKVVEDISLLQLSFRDGSIATVQYLANGNVGYPKERIEVFFDAKSIRLDNFRSIAAWGLPGISTRLRQKQDKGHLRLVQAFLTAVKNGGNPPIPIDELLEVGVFAVEAARLARDGGGQVRASELELLRPGE